MKNKHPYYDGEKKQRSDEFAYKALGFCFIALFVLYTITLVMTALFS